MKPLILLAALFAAAAPAQTISTNTAVDDVARAAAQAAADSAATKCAPLAATPPTEVPGGTVGSGVNCRLVNAADNRISRTAVFSYNSSGAVLCGGSTTCTWDVALPAGAGSYPVLYTALGRAANCSVASSTNTGFTGMVCTQPNISVVIAGSSVITVGLTPGQVFVLSLPSTQASQ